MQEFFYYNRDGRKRPVSTNCIIVDGHLIAKGQALCSDKDEPCKKTGRRIAQGRALKALHVQKDNFCEQTKFYKFQINPILSQFEQRIIGAPKQ